MGKRGGRSRPRADKLGKIGSPKSEASHREVGLNARRASRIAQPPIVTEDEDGKKHRRPRTLVFRTASDRPDGLASIRRRVLGPAMIKAGVTVPALYAKGQPVRDGEGKPILRAKDTGLHCLRHLAVSSWLKACDGRLRGGAGAGRTRDAALILDTYGHLLDKAGEPAAVEKLVLG